MMDYFLLTVDNLSRSFDFVVCKIKGGGYDFCEGVNLRSFIIELTVFCKDRGFKVFH